MQLSQSLTHDFVDSVNELEQEIGKEKTDRLLELSGIGSSSLDVVEFASRFFSSTNLADISVDPNANVTNHGIENFAEEVTKPFRYLFALNMICQWAAEEGGSSRAKRILKKLLMGEIFMNDLSHIEKPYCYSFTLDRLLHQGCNFAIENYTVGPPKRSDSYVDLAVQMISYISNQIAGACSFPTFFVDLDWFYRKEYGSNYTVGGWEKCKYTIENQFQNFIYSVNWKFRGTQSPFSNVSIFDRNFLKELFTNYYYPDGTLPDLSSIYVLQKKFAEYFNRIFGEEGIFTFPVMTLTVSTDENRNVQDEEFLKWACKVNSEKALFNLYCGEPNTLSHCCRLRNGFLQNPSDLGYTNLLGTSSLNIGSHRVVGLNLPHIALRSQRENIPVETIFEEDIEDIHLILNSHRGQLKDEISRGFLPLYDHGWVSLSRQYSTVGFVGAYEFMELSGRSMSSETDRDYLLSILKRINELNDKESKRVNYPFNLEQIPAESMAVRLAKKDKVVFDKEDYYELYGNQYFPLTTKVPLTMRVEVQGLFDSETSGGSILHINLPDGRNITPEIMERLVRFSIEKGCVYFAVNLTFAKCTSDHFTVGRSDTCHICSSPIAESYSRVVGFITPVKKWHPTRRTEFENRYGYEQIADIA